MQFRRELLTVQPQVFPEFQMFPSNAFEKFGERFGPFCLTIKAQIKAQGLMDLSLTDF